MDLRLLSATHRSLAEMVRNKQFREDLYYRINVIELEVPALRSRPEDLDELTDDILRRQAQRLGLPVPTIGATARAALRAHAFPGNVRELENVLERALALHSGSIEVGDLQLRADPIGMEAQAMPAVGEQHRTEDLEQQLEHVERESIVKALQQVRYNKTAAARLLGISFRALRYKLKKLGID